MKRGFSLIKKKKYIALFLCCNWLARYTQEKDWQLHRESKLQLLELVNERGEKRREEACVECDMIIKLMRGALFHY